MEFWQYVHIANQRRKLVSDELQKFQISWNCTNFSSRCWRMFGHGYGYGWIGELAASVVTFWKLEWKYVWYVHTLLVWGGEKKEKCLSTFLRRISYIKRNIQFSIQNLCIIPCTATVLILSRTQSQEMSTFVSYKSFCCA